MPTALSKDSISKKKTYDAMGIVIDSSEVESESESEWEMERRQAKGNSPMKKGVNTGSKRTDV